MRTLYSVTLRRTDGSLYIKTVAATDIMGSQTAALEKVQAKLQEDEGITNATLFSMVTVAPIDIE